ncbi:cell division control protein/putative DNA repair exonuclease [Cryomyces antarcticus]
MTSSLPPSSRDYYEDPPGLTQRAVAAIATLVPAPVSHLVHRTALSHNGKGRPNSRGRWWSPHRRLTLPNLLVLAWITVLYWGERLVFKSSVEGCAWEYWERWPSQASPHHLTLIADPQLVDPHTYPGRPWPLSTLTVAYTDQYLRRSYSLMNQKLEPDTIFFLGDLFDGGREWSTYGKEFKKSDEGGRMGWKRYGDRFWLHEYERFGRVFFDHQQLDTGSRRTRQEGRKVIASLPGNHDLGFGNGIQKSVRDRFNTYFGDGNRVDVIGNHTFVSVDSVSLSAQDQPGGDAEIWKPTVDFLEGAQAAKQKAVSRRLKEMKGLPRNRLFKHEVTHPHDLGRQQTEAEVEEEAAAGSGFPTILLTHVPLYRAPGTPCGPLRERSPPSAPGLENDEPNAIAVAAGYQYQNVLTPQISQDLVDKIGSVGHVFSGDDHDYCELVHLQYQPAVGNDHQIPGAAKGIREITVKSMSWAMGVRKPGFLFVSLWNPVDENGFALGSGGKKQAESSVVEGLTGGETKSAGSGATVQTHLCLLPDQLAIFIRYASLLGITLLCLFGRAIVVAIGLENHSVGTESPVLPVMEREKPTSNGYGYPPPRRRAQSQSTGTDEASSMSSTSSTGNGHLFVRSSNARTRSVSPGGYGLPPQRPAPLIEKAGYYPPPVKEQWDEEDYLGAIDVSDRKPKRRKGKVEVCLREFWASTARVAAFVLLWYAWLLRRW